jgi:hypothetical protein
MSAYFTREDILRQLDECARLFTFPMLDNGYVYLGTTRLTAYSDRQSWALVIEVVGYNPRTGWHEGLDDSLYCFGNCLSRPPGLANEDFLRFTTDGPEGPTFDDECGWFVRPEANSVKIRGEVVPLDLSPSRLAANGIELVEPPDVTGAELMRSLLLDHREQLLATEKELRQRVPPQVPQVLRLKEWHHPDLARDELPSESPTFQMIADVLVTGDPSHYLPSAEPNTHWRLWPESGML